VITGDKPLTALHVTWDIEIVDWEALVLYLKENLAHEMGKLTLLGHIATSSRVHENIDRAFGVFRK